MNQTVILPNSFSDLAAWAAQWGRSNEIERSRIRWKATAEDFANFYAAIMPRLDAILSYLADVPLGNLNEADANLFNLAAAFAEASPHHELYKGSADVPFSFSAHRFVAGHGNQISWTA